MSEISVLYPSLAMPLVVGRPGSVAAVEAAAATEDKTVVVASQRSPEVEEPALADLFSIATKAVIKKLERGDDVLRIVVQGIERVELLEGALRDGHLAARVRVLAQPADAGAEVEARQREVLDLAARIFGMVNPQAQAGLSQMIAQVSDPLPTARCQKKESHHGK